MALLGGCASTPLSVAQDEGWIEARTEHFTVWTNLPPEDARAVARDIEIFRAAVLLITRVEDVSSTHPTWIYVFDSTQSFGPFNDLSLALGYMKPTLRANILTTARDRHLDSSTILKHEYTHWLVRNDSKRTYPMWFDEGFAEFMATVGEDGDTVVIGDVPAYRIPNLKYSRWIHLRDILAPVDWWSWPDERKSMFYAQAWAFIHYWYTDHDRRAQLSAGLAPYLDAVQSGTPFEDAFETSFGMSVDEANDALIDYLRAGRFSGFGVPTSKLEFANRVRGRRLPEHEVAEQLGMLCYVRNDQACARSLFEHAVALAPESSRATAGLADVEKSAGNVEEAERLFDLTIELDPEDALSYLDRGEFDTLRAAETNDPAQRRSLLRSARRDFVRASEIAGPRPETYAFYGATFLFDGEEASKGLETLEEAHRLLPANATIRLMLADLYLCLERREEAVEMARPAFLTRHGGQLDAESKAVLDAIASGEQARLHFFGKSEPDAVGDATESEGAHDAPERGEPSSGTQRSDRP